MQNSGESLWESLLRESSKRSKVKEGTIIIVGDDNVGKNSLASAVAGAAVEKSSIALPTYVMMSSNDDVDDDKDKMQQNGEDFAKLHSWILSKSTIGTFGKVILQNPVIERVGVVIVLDFSDYTKCIAVLKEWLVLVQKELLSALPLAMKNEQNEANASYIDLCSRHRGVSEKLQQERAELAEEGGAIAGQVRNNAQKYCGVPLVIVGCKADVLDDAAYKASANEVKEVQAYIRYMCLQLGASFVMAAAVPVDAMPSPDRSTGGNSVNISFLRKFLFHSLFPEAVSLELSLRDVYSEAVVPAGLDSDELINLSCIHRGAGGKSPTKAAAGGAEKTINGSTLLYALTQKLVPDAAVGGPAEFTAQSLLNGKAGAEKGAAVQEADCDSVPVVTVEDEQEWLSGLHAQLVKLGASGSVVMDTAEPTPAPTKTPSPAPGRAATPGSPGPDGPSTGATKANSPSRAEPVDAAGSGAAAGIATVAPKPSRRASTRAAAAAAAGASAGGQDPTDFFKNLLSKK